MQPGLCRKIFLPGTRLAAGIRAECGAGARLTATEQEAPIGEAASTQESKQARALAGCVTLDKPTPFSEPPPPCLEPEDWIKGVAPAHPARSRLCLSRSDAGHPRSIPTGTLDWERGGSLWAWPAVGLSTWTLLFCM